MNPRAGFLRRPHGFQDRSLQPLGYISKCIPAPTFLGKRRETWREIPFSLNFLSPQPLKTQGKLKTASKILSRFQDCPVMTALATPPWCAERLYAQKKLPQIPVLSIEKRRCTTIFGRKGLHKRAFYDIVMRCMYTRIHSTAVYKCKGEYLNERLWKQDLRRRAEGRKRGL